MRLATMTLLLTAAGGSLRAQSTACRDARIEGTVIGAATGGAIAGFAIALGISYGPNGSKKGFLLLPLGGAVVGFIEASARPPCIPRPIVITLRGSGADTLQAPLGAADVRDAARPGAVAVASRDEGLAMDGRLRLPPPSPLRP